MSGNGYASVQDLEQLVGFRKYSDVQIGELRFRIQSITEAEWSEISSANFDMRKGGLNAVGLRQSDAKLVAASLVDGEGNLLFRGGDAVGKIGQMPAWVVEPLVRACREINNLRSDEDAAKNSLDGSDSATSSAEPTPH